jgi:hypothetical protein
MTERTNERPEIGGRLLWGLIVLALGVLWMLDNLGAINAWEIVLWWPLVALFWGLMVTFGIGRKKARPVSGAIWCLVGLVGLLNMFGFLSATIFDLWPLVFVAFGAALIWQSMRPRTAHGESTEPRLDSFTVLGGAEHRVVAQDFREGDVTAILGGAVVDLRGARLAGPTARIHAFAALGGILIVVPKGWRVASQVGPVLGAFQDSTAPATDPGAPLVVVHGTAFMGGIEVMNDTKTASKLGIHVRRGVE